MLAQQYLAVEVPCVHDPHHLLLLDNDHVAHTAELLFMLQAACWNQRCWFD